MNRLVMKTVSYGLILISILLSYKILTVYSERKKAVSNIQQLPKAEFRSLDNKPVNLYSYDDLKNLVIIYFHPDCEFCRNSAKELAAIEHESDDVQWVMITPDDSLPRIESFIQKNHIVEIGNLEILIDPHLTFGTHFGKTVIPSVYIYGDDRKLVRNFYGETSMEFILSALKSPVK
jgi:hypothetical protein